MILVETLLVFALRTVVASSKEDYDPDFDEALTLPRTSGEIQYQILDRGATIDPYTNQTRYDGFQLMRAYPTTDQHLEALNFLQSGKKSLN